MLKAILSKVQKSCVPFKLINEKLRYVNFTEGVIKWLVASKHGKKHKHLIPTNVWCTLRIKETIEIQSNPWEINKDHFLKTK